MGQFVRKRTVIEAMQYPGMRELADAVKVLDWLDQNGIKHHHDSGLVMETAEGDVLVSPDDWIIKGEKGNFISCKKGHFEATYEPFET